MIWQTEPGLENWLLPSNQWIRKSKLDLWLIQRLLILKVGEHPPGWPRLSAAIDSDPNFMIYRRFGYLRTRLLTYHQDVLREMEERLDKLDIDDFKSDHAHRASSWRQGDDARQPALRKELFHSLNTELYLYG